MIGMDWLLAIVAIVAGLYFYGTRTFGFFKKRSFPALPSPTPFFGHMGPLVLRTMSFGDMLQKFYDDSKGYKFCGFFDFSRPVVLARDPEAIKMITVKDFDHFADRVVIFTEDIDPLFGKNLLSLEGQRWKNMRATLSPAFTSSKMKGMFALISESGKQLGDHLEKHCKALAGRQLEVDVKDLFTRYANDVIATAAFGVKCDSLAEPENEFYVTGKESVNFSGTQMFRFFGYRISPTIMKTLGVSLFPEKSRLFFHNLVVDTMEVREREGIIRPDLIHLMMEAKKGTLKHEGTDEVDHQAEPNKPGKKMTTELDDEDITAQAFLFFLAGFDTTSTHLGFLTNLLATHPDVQRRVQEEIDDILKADGGELTYDGIQKAKYLDMCMSETLRLWPPGVASNRQCVKPYVLPATANTPSIKINKGDGVWISIIGIHRDPEYFPDPERFDPERFSDENKHSIQPFTYMPFGTGPRNCIGMRFAQMEVKIVMMHVLSRFNLEVSPKTQLKMKMAKKMNMTIDGGFWVGVKPRT